MKALITMSAVFIVIIQNYAQQITFKKHIEFGIGYSLIQTKDENFIIPIKSGNKLIIIAADKNGEIIWRKDNNLFSVFAPKIIQSDDGDFIITASNNKDSLYNILLVKINSFGDTLWTKTLTSQSIEIGASIIETKDKGFLIYGFTPPSPAELQVKNQVIYKLNENFELEWKKNYFVTHSPSFKHFLQITEWSNGYAFLTNKYLTKINLAGDSLFSIPLNTCYSLSKTLDEKLMLCGKDILLQIDSLGNKLWEKTDSGLLGYYLSPITGDNFIIASASFLIKINSQGDMLWWKNTDYRDIYYVTEIDDNGLLCIGETGYLIKTDADGNYRQIEFRFPKTEDYLTIGKTYKIYWQSNYTDQIKIDLSVDDGISWQPIIEKMNDSSFCEWLVPNIPSNHCRFRISNYQYPLTQDISERFIIGYNPSFDFIAVNQIKMWIKNNGDGSHDPYTDGQGLYWPGGENATIGASFEDGLLWGGKINGEIKLNGNTHRQGLQSGKILEGGIAGEPIPIWKIRKDWQNLLSGPERDRYEYNYNNWPGDLGAPFIDIDNDIKFTRGIDQPRFLGDEVLWYAANDLDTLISRCTYGSDPIGLEIQLTTFGYDMQDDLADVVFKKYKIMNKSGNQIEDMYLSYWADPDLGDAADDFTGCDTTLNLGYIYNGDNNDVGYYGIAPPAIGYKFVQGPISEGSISDNARINDEWRKGIKNLPMTAFVMFIGANSTYKDPSQGNYDGTIELYNYMQGLIWNGNPFINPVTKLSTKYVLPGDPVAGVGWYEGKGWPGGGFSPDDRRFLMSSGPFNMVPEDTQEVVLAIIIARGTDNINSVAELKRKASVVQEFYDSHMPTSVNDRKMLPTKFELYQNYPNPFNPSTTIRYRLPVNSKVTIKIFNTLGQEVETLVNENQNAGFHSKLFTLNSSLPSGVYFYQLKVGSFVSTKKLILLK